MNNVVNILVKHRWLFFIASLLLLAFSATGLKYFVFDSSPRIYFKDHFEPYERFLDMEETYGKDFKVFYMLSTTEGDVFDTNNLKALREITAEAWKLPFVSRVDSLSNFQYTYSQDDELNVEEFFNDEVIADPARVAKRKQAALSDPDIVKRLVSSDGKHAAILLSLNMTGPQAQSPEGMAMVQKVYDLEEAIKAKYSTVDIAVTGNLISSYHNFKIAERDLSVMLPVMFVLMFVLLGFFLRSVSSVIVAFAVAVVSTLGSLGLAAWCNITFSMLAMDAVIITLIVAIAHCIHIFTQLFQELRTKPKEEALAESLRVNFYALFMTSLTTVIGFLSLNTSNLPPAAHLGNAAAIGAALAWLFSLTMLPALVMLLPFKAHKTGEFFLERQMVRLGNVIITRKYLVLSIMALLTAGALYFSFQNQLNDRLTETLHKPHLFRSDNEAIDQHFGAMYINNYDFDSGSENGIADPAYLKAMDQFATYLRQQPEITSVFAFSDIVKRLNKSMHNDDPAFYTIPDDRELIAQYILLYEMSVPFGLDLGNQITQDKRKSIVIVSMPSQSTQSNIAIDQRITQWQQENLPKNLQPYNISLATIWSYLTVDSLTNALQGSLLALVIISAVLLFMLKSLRYGIISLIPNILPGAFGFAAWYFMSGDVGLGLTCVLLITIGIVVDDTVHFLAKYQKALAAHKGDTEKAVRSTFRQVGPAMLITTVVLAAGFSVLALSAIIVNSALGLVTAIIITAALLLDVFLLPVLLLIFDKNRKKQYQLG